MMTGFSGSERGTADASIGPAGAPIRLYAINAAITGTIAGLVILRNGTSSSGDIFITENAKRGTEAANITVYYGDQGILFSSGLFYDHDSNFDYVTFQYRVEN